MEMGGRRNRDIAVLRNVLADMQQAAMLEVAGEKMRDRMYSITRVFSGLPGGGGGPAHGLDELYGKLDETGQRYARDLSSCLESLQAAQRILDGIPDGRARVFVALLYAADAEPRRIREALYISEWKFRKWRETIEQAECMAAVDWSVFAS